MPAAVATHPLPAVPPPALPSRPATVATGGISPAPDAAGPAVPARGNPQALGAVAASVAGADTAVGQGVLRKRLWDTNYLAGLRDATQRDPIRFELVNGEMAAGTIAHLEHRDGEPVYVAGSLTQPEAGRFFFQKQSRSGVAGAFVGVVEFPASQKAYRLEPSGPGGASELVERSLGKVVCLRLPPATNTTEEIPPLRPDAFPTVPIPPYQSNRIVLESLPGATAVIYLDFQGGYTPTWGGIAYERPNVSNSQIRDVWKRVAEDYLSFNINVTTDRKVFDNAPQGSRMRVVITPTPTAAPGAGGVAYIGSFNWTGTPDTPCWVFMVSGKSCAEAASHEVGHTLNLGHDGQDAGSSHTEYYGGQGSGAVGWAPIMGVGYYQPVSQWSKGEYTNANQLQDDLAIITGNNNDVDYRTDDTGSTLATSRYLEVYSNAPAFAEGVLERTGDTDAFQFTTSGGTVSLRADPVGDWGNPAISLTLCHSNGTVLASNNPQTTLWAALSTNLAAGTYTIRVTGAGRNNPLTDGFSAYGSLGYYTVTGAVAGARLPTRFTIPETAPNGLLVGTVTATNPNGNPLVYAIRSGNTSNTFALNNSGALTVLNNGTLNYETLARNTQLPVQFEMFVNITNTVNPALTELNRRVLVLVTNVNEPPTLAGFSASVFEHTQPGSALGTVTGTDPDYYTLLAYSITAGNSNNMFVIDTNTGLISLNGDLDAAAQRVYNLTVVVSDQTPPTPLLATSAVVVTVLTNPTPFRPGAISYAVYENLSGTALGGLTNATVFPRDASGEKLVGWFEGESDRGDNYGAVLRGYLIPPATGYYTFWIASDDNGDLWLSTSTNAAAVTRIASVSGSTSQREWTKYSSQQSAAISLVRGQAYYIEARVKEGTGNDNLAVAWQCTSNGIAREVIPGRFLAPYYLNYLPHALSFAVSLHRDAITGAQVGVVETTDANANDGHTFAITGGNASGLFTIDSATGVVRVADAAALQATTQTNFTLQITTTDTGTPPLSGVTNVTINLVAPGVIAATRIQQEIWTGLGSGTAVSDLTNQARFPKRPDALRALTSFDTGENYGENYGSRVRAYLTPTSSGAYTFFIASDDSSQLRFGTNPATASVIASVSGSTDYQDWTASSSQKSAALSLVAGQAYYIEALQKEGTGGDHLSVAWAGPGLTGTNVIAGSFLTPLDLNYAPDLAGATVRVPITIANGAVVTNLTATDSALDGLAYTIVSGNLSNTFAIDPATGVLTVANNLLIASSLASSFSLVVQVQDSGYGGLFPLKSAQVTVTVQVLDSTLPFVWTGGGSDANWSTGLNWNGARPTNGGKLVFAGSLRQSNANDLLASVGPVFLNNGGFHLAGQPLLTQAGLSSTGTNTWAIATTLKWPQTFTSGSGQLTVAGPVDNNGNDLTLLVSNRMRLAGSFSGAGGLIKAGAGTLTIGGVNTYSGETRLSQGTLVLADSATFGSTPTISLEAGTTLDVAAVAGGFVLADGQILRGSGSIKGSVTVPPGAILAPGEDDLGSLVFDHNLTLAGTTRLKLTKNGPASNDVIGVVNALTCGGAVEFQIVGGSGLTAGDTFRCFSAARFSGAFASVRLPPLEGGLAWDSSRLAVDGSLQVAVGPAVTLLSPTVPTANLPAGVGLVLEAAATAVRNPAGLRVGWVQLGGPGTVTFGNPGTTNTTALFSMAGTYVLRLVATDGPLESGASLTVNVGVTPDLWTAVGVGTVPATVGYAQSNGVATITAGGVGIQGSGAADDFYYLQQAVTGNAQITARVVSVQNVSGASSRAGVMMREVATRDSREIFMGLTSLGGGRLIWRGTPGSSGGSAASVNSTLALPYWVQLTRVGNVFTAYTAPDAGGTPGAWIRQGSSQTIAMSNTVLIGLAAASGSASVAGTVTLDQVSLSPAPYNTGPMVNAGGDADSSSDTIVLAGSVADDGRPVPPGAVTTSWTKLSGPGEVVFAQVHATNTSATLAAAGDYTLGLVADDGQVRTFDAVTIRTGLGLPRVSVAVLTHASEVGPREGLFLVSRTGPTDNALTVACTAGGSAVGGADYVALPGTVTFPAGAASTTLAVNPLENYQLDPNGLTVVLRLSPSTEYAIGGEGAATLTIEDGDVLPTVAIVNPGLSLVRIPAGVGLMLEGVASSTRPQAVLSPQWSQLAGPGTIAFSPLKELETAARFPASGLYTLQFTASDGALQAGASLAVQVGYEWTATRVGTTPTGVGYAPSNGVVFLTAGGLGVQGSGAFDDFYFLQQEATGDVQITARVRAVQNIAGASSRAGVMIREGTTRDGREVFMGLTSLNGGRFIWRATPGSAGGSSASVNSALAQPYWVRLTRVGNVFTAYTAPDLDPAPGPWTQQGVSQTILMSNSVRIGLAAASGSATLTGTMVVDNVVIVSEAVNYGPFVRAGTGQTTANTTLALHGLAYDDGLPNPPGRITTRWTQVSGPSGSVFADVELAQTSVSFSQDGTYLLRLTASDGQVTTFDDTEVAVLRSPLSPPRITGFHPIAGGQFRLQFEGTAPETFSVQVSTNLQTWEPLNATLQASNGLYQFTDPAAPSAPQRFYRLCAP